MTISRATNLLYTPPWQPIMHFNWTSSSRHCFSAAEIFHFGLIRIHSNARNSICVPVCLMSLAQASRTQQKIPSNQGLQGNKNLGTRKYV